MSYALDRLHEDWQAVPLSLRAAFELNNRETVRLRARVRELEQQLERERRLAHQLARPAAKTAF